MVSSSLDMELDALLATLERLRASSAEEAEYQQLRSALPKEWPL